MMQHPTSVDYRLQGFKSPVEEGSDVINVADNKAFLRALHCIAVQKGLLAVDEEAFGGKLQRGIANLTREVMRCGNDVEGIVSAMNLSMHDTWRPRRGARVNEFIVRIVQHPSEWHDGADGWKNGELGLGWLWMEADITIIRAMPDALQEDCIKSIQVWDGQLILTALFVTLHNLIIKRGPDDKLFLQLLEEACNLKVKLLSSIDADLRNKTMEGVLPSALSQPLILSSLVTRD
ncbi:unnamed protein product [Vitrella brassicaformis CCMP3155]|uniref:Uncharacterized protein n=1 Tax=Vitrella brassicaformis (strain CCMP3155) TaxID=1169540 RepID=A0A0G4GWL1_VITBC|nr:unnamed protein product [Vitrella brassicaformis CCMP3155]|eukprot:CEM35137.1 unnamed protein product [Vitrella brassicaformis CCMP3155]